MAGSNKRRIVVEFLGDDKSLSSTSSKVESSTSKLGGHLKKVGLIAGAGLAAGAALAGKALFDMGKAAVEDQESAKQLAKALQNNAGATRQQINATEDWITAQGKAFGIADDKLRPALGDLVRATGSVAKAQHLARLAMDISAGSGKDLGAVSKALAKAQNGNVAGLARLGVATKDAHGKTKSFAAIQDELAKKFNGSAKTAANTFGGRMGRLKLQFSEAQEALGYKLLPVAEKFAGWLTNEGVPAVQKFAGWLREHLGPIIDNLRATIQKNLPQIKRFFTDAFASIKSTVTSVVSIIQSLWARFGDTLTSYAQKSLANVVRVIGGALRVVSGIFKVVSSLLKGDWKGVWDGLKQITSGALAVLKGLISQGLNLFRTVFKLGWSAIKAIVGAAWDGIKHLVALGAEGVVNAVKSIPSKVKALGGLFKNAGHFLIQQMVNGLKGAAGLVSDIAGNVWNAVKSLLNSAIGKINAALEFKISLPGPDIHVNPPNIPRLASGGIVKKRPGGMLAVLGEGRYDEAVVPLGPNARSSTSSGDISLSVPIVLQLDSKNVWQGLLKLKRQNGNVELGLA